MSKAHSEVAAALASAAISAVKTRGVMESQAEIQRLVWEVVSIHTMNTPISTSADIRSITYLKILDWLTTGKRGKKTSVDSLLSPSHILQTAKNIGYNVSRNPVQTCQLEEFTPIPEEEDEPEYTLSSFHEEWLTLAHKLRPEAKAFLKEVPST